MSACDREGRLQLVVKQEKGVRLNGAVSLGRDYQLHVANETLIPAGRDSEGQ